MDKETVLLESISDENQTMVSVIPYDLESKSITGNCIEVLPRYEAQEEYEVVGEILNGEIKVYGDESSYEDYIDESFYIDEDD